MEVMSNKADLVVALAPLGSNTALTKMLVATVLIERMNFDFIMYLFLFVGALIYRTKVTGIKRSAERLLVCK